MKIRFSRASKTKKNTASLKIIILLFLALLAASFGVGVIFERNVISSSLFREIRQTIFSKLSNTLNKWKGYAIEELDSEIRLYQSNGLSTIFLDIPFDSMQALEEKRQVALAVGILFASDDDYVPAALRFLSDRSIDIKLRLKGDWTDHLQGEKRSFRIHIQDEEGAVLGMRRFSLQDPEVRNYIYEWGYHQNLILENVLATRYHFVNVIINGEHKGVYALEESFTEDLLESQERREGIIIRLDENLYWENVANYFYYDDVAEDIGYFLLVNDRNAEIKPFREGHVAQNEDLVKELETAKNLLYSFNQGMISAEEVLDVSIWGKYFAITDLWAGGHGTAWINLRFYFNPITGLLEPIAFDGFAMHPSYNRNELAFPFSSAKLFNIPGVQKSYIETLERITTPAYLKKLKELFGEEISGYYEILSGEYANMNKELYPQLPWEDLEVRSEMLSRNIKPKHPFRGYFQLVQNEENNYLQLDLINSMIVPVQVNEIILDENSIQFKNEWCQFDSCQNIINNIEETVILSGNKTNFRSTTFLIPTSVFKDYLLNFEIQEIMTIRVSLYGGTEIFDVPIISAYVPQGISSNARPDEDLEGTLIKHQFLVKVNDTQLAIKQGDWAVTGDLVIPEGYNLFIPENTTLRFEENSVFLSFGQLEFLGEEETPVLITAQDSEKGWGGLVVLDVKETSTWRYVVLEKMHGIERDGWILTGGVTFYQSPIQMSYTIIGNNTSEDALNVIRSSFSFENIEFFNTSSDAFDGDFTTGTIVNSSFNQISGDGIDLSGSEVTVKDSYFVDIGDKAISVGEQSNVTIESIVIRNVDIGVASKDLSLVVISSSIIDSAKTAGLAAYIKKHQYGPAYIEAQDVEILNTEKNTLCQTNSEIIVNGDIVVCEEFDVDTLYEEEVLGN